MKCRNSLITPQLAYQYRSSLINPETRQRKAAVRHLFNVKLCESLKLRKFEKRESLECETLKLRCESLQVRKCLNLKWESLEMRQFSSAKLSSAKLSVLNFKNAKVSIPKVQSAKL